MAELQVFEDKFNLPVLEFHLQILRERFPDLDIRKGSALYRAVVLPFSVLFQPYRDRTSILRRNQSLRFYQYMRSSELDKLVANFFIDRLPAATASGTARIYFAQPADLVVPASASFLTADGLQFRPVTTIVVSASELSLNQEDGLFFADIPTIALTAGEDYAIAAESLFSVTGVANVVKVTNKAKFSGGADQESNVALVSRTKNSLATRTLTSRNAMIATLNEAFPGLIISQEIIGYGDVEMLRDVVSAFASYDELFGTGFCRKFNVAYDPAARLIWTGAGAPPATYELRGAVVDASNSYSTLTGGDPYFWFSLEATRDGEEIRSALQYGDVLRLNTSDISDPDAGDYIVKDIVFSTPFSTVTPPALPDRNEETHIVILDRPLTASLGPGSFDPTPGSVDLTKYKFTIVNGVRTDKFHIGGKADVYLHSTGLAEDEIVIASLAVSPIAPNFFDVPISATPSATYENGKAFLLPVVNIIRVDQVDPSNADVVIRTLELGTDYFFITKDEALRFTPNEDNFLRFIDTDPAGANFLNARIKVVYETNLDIKTIQEFMDTSTTHDTTKDILVKAAQTVQLDVTLSFSGEATAEEAIAAVESYILGVPQAGEATVNDIVAVLNLFGVNDIQMPVTLVSRVIEVNGTVTQQESQDRLSLLKLQRFVPVDALSVTKV